MHGPLFHFVTPRCVERAVATGLRDVLSPAERETFDALALPRRRRDWLAGRLAAKRALRGAPGAALGATPFSAISILGGPRGAPCFLVDGRPELGAAWNISLAHHDGYAVCALASTGGWGRVGVDLEWDRPIPPALLLPVLTAGERRALAGRAQALAPSPVEIWAMKEAAMKAVGAASIAMPQVELSWRSSDRVTARVVTRPGLAVRVRVARHRWGAHLVAHAGLHTRVS